MNDHKPNPTMNNPILQPYLFFNGRCEEALAFYQAALGATVDTVMRFRESPEPPPPGVVPSGWEDKIMHVTFRIGTNIVMASDSCEEGTQFNGFFLSLGVATEDEANEVFAALADGGQVVMPLAKTFWSPRFGMVTDRFGLGWMITVTPAT